MKKKKAKATTLVGNMRIRAEAASKSRARVDHALLRNKILTQQQANQYKLGLDRLDAAAIGTPTQQRAHVQMGRNELQQKYDDLKLS